MRTIGLAVIFCLLNISTFGIGNSVSTAPFDCAGALAITNRQRHLVGVDKTQWLKIVRESLYGRGDPGSFRLIELIDRSDQTDLKVSYSEGPEVSDHLERIAKASDAKRAEWLSQFHQGAFNSKSNVNDYVRPKFLDARSIANWASLMGFSAGMVGLARQNFWLADIGIVVSATGAVLQEFLPRNPKEAEAIRERIDPYRSVQSDFRQFDLNAEILHLYPQEDAKGPFRYSTPNVHLLYYLGAETKTPHLVVFH